MSVSNPAPAPAEAVETGIRLGPLRIREGVTYKHLYSLFFVSFFGIVYQSPPNGRTSAWRVSRSSALTWYGSPRWR